MKSIQSYALILLRDKIQRVFDTGTYPSCIFLDLAGYLIH